MCDRCLFDMMMYGDPSEPAPPAREKGRFQAEAAEDSPANGEQKPSDGAGDPGGAQED